MILLYIDPASTSALLYIFIAIGATLAFTLKGSFYRVLNFVKGKGFKNNYDFEGHDILFYSEGTQYWNVFLPVIKALEKKNVQCGYLTSDENDPGLSYESQLMKAKYIGNLTMTSVYLNKLEAKFVGMTTPQLDVMMIRRSKKVGHYGHIVHAPIDIFSYRKFAFDYFDSVFCSGYHQIEGIRKLEEKRGTDKKLLLKSGLTYYDVMLEHNKKNGFPKLDNKIVLVAPTWKEYSILNRFGVRFFENLLKDTNFDVILRPHPQSYVSFPEVIGEIEKHFENEPRFSVDRNPLANESMEKSSVMISDLSGVIWDYAFLYAKPVMLLKTEADAMLGFEGSELDYEMWEMRERPRLGKNFDENDIDNIGAIVTETIENPSVNALETLRDESVYNFGKAGETVANQIIDIVNK
ncbi:CDP-glycerol glycerophosphotransferase family protein [uncultured Draconibacterium sp.]|uniref:CDP-glycerol glycerophosphotransferase family protein n=1 Tax=uncultured Draconibacterium sp. TaxID=1573823 RepID=UPI0025FC9950|nr:CDP-glycerol glycerophosphotransferase family protein [uncultured Draconibacterium sp.]